MEKNLNMIFMTVFALLALVAVVAICMGNIYQVATLAVCLVMVAAFKSEIKRDNNCKNESR